MGWLGLQRGDRRVEEAEGRAALSVGSGQMTDNDREEGLKKKGREIKRKES